MVVVGMVMILAPVASIFLSTGENAHRFQHFLVVGFASFALFWFIYFQLGSIHQPEVSMRMLSDPAAEANVPITIPPRKLSQ